jgi:hypothetical protein
LKKALVDLYNFSYNRKISYRPAIDVLFSLGKSGFQRFIDFGGRINKIEPVGSLFMEHYWFKKPIKLDEKFDILFLGINVTNGVDRIDKYDGWADDYYSSFKWLVKIKKEIYERGFNSWLNSNQRKF